MSNARTDSGQRVAMRRLVRLVGLICSEGQRRKLVKPSTTSRLETLDILEYAVTRPERRVAEIPVLLNNKVEFRKVTGDVFDRVSGAYPTITSGPHKGATIPIPFSQSVDKIHVSSLGVGKVVEELGIHTVCQKIETSNADSVGRALLVENMKNLVRLNKGLPQYKAFLKFVSNRPRVILEVPYV